MLRQLPAIRPSHLIPPSPPPPTLSPLYLRRVLWSEIVDELGVVLNMRRASGPPEAGSPVLLTGR